MDNWAGRNGCTGKPCKSPGSNRRPEGGQGTGHRGPRGDRPKAGAEGGRLSRTQEPAQTDMFYRANRCERREQAVCREKPGCRHTRSAHHLYFDNGADLRTVHILETAYGPFRATGNAPHDDAAAVDEDDL